MRLIIVALLGIEITIIALASAASAATHPEGTPAQSGLYEGLPMHGSGPSAAEIIAGTYEMGPHPWAYEELMLLEMGDWPALDQRWPLAAVERAQVIRERRADAAASSKVEQAERAADRAEQRAEEAAEEAERSGTRETATQAVKRIVRTGVAQMPQARPRVAYKRAQVDLTRALPRKAAIRMSHATASGWLRSAGLRTKSTGNCASKHMHHCTSLDRVRTGTIARAIELKQESGCPIMVTGGTERGHAPGHFSHGNGYKLDISHNACIDRHITKHHDKAGVRSDGATIYKAKSGTTFFDESDHWDILFR
ncbi:hypothetical protein [Nonomuraea gerenzanensis]|uniref:Uncharacterized protein n=1 Tax=Nonomuraea gerenzanensis TaxID=93944 RepID=A0A1M4DWV5_9ACTN|nr:hypothetical protein [Nonomuraea gerenzanensis]UBU13384.1 hypothetical protein LCN96_55690 [Nonomuraea gerenzanensis]SBO91043.1 hypothetical protein BN4615_P557 [Nonomuraea gerenzanensis]